ncbi:GyrI-like domain-containing protein [Paenibacillus cymbidii]|uniref:GyrI-like domain-containing protein n=1 Tax=Paenibacillus cymbidii TaxID=1639034 RepID=UPI001080D2AB|nr:GyrI-like domain-containing protein [Paenibacillus cymbidii]
METIVVEKPSFTVIGKLGRGAARDAVDWIPPLWQVANSRFAEASDLAKRDAEGNLVGIWGAMSDVLERFERWGEEGKYLAGVEAVDDAVAPEGWTRWVVPAFRYVAAPCTLDSYKETMQRILTDYLPSHGYAIAGAIQEYYRPGDREEHLSLYVPIGRL